MTLWLHVGYGPVQRKKYEKDQKLTLNVVTKLLEAYKSLTLSLGFPEEAFEKAVEEEAEEFHSHRNCHHVWGDSDHDGHEECLICGLLREDI